MKIAFVYFWGPWAGGIERFLIRLSGWLADKGIEVDLVLAKAEGELLPEVPTTVQVKDLGAEPILLASKLRIGHTLPAVPKLARYLRENQPTVVLAFYVANFAALWARILAKVPVPVIISERVHPTLSSQVSPNPLLDRLMPLLKRLFYPLADEIVAVSKGSANDLARITGLPRERIRVIYNPVSPDIFQKAQEPLDHPWFLDKQPPVILGVGRLSVEKDFPTLIQAFALVRQNRPCRLMILGEGEERPKLERLVRELGLENDISLPGFESNPFKFMKNAAVFVLSSKYEGFGNVIIEALACGCPVVSTDCPSGPSEILEDGKWGKLVPVGDVEAMAKAILETLDNPPDRKALQQRAMDFHIDKIGQQWLELIKSVIQKE